MVFCLFFVAVFCLPIKSFMYHLQHSHIDHVVVLSWVKISAGDILKYFSSFPRKSDLTLQADYLLWKKLQEVSDPF